MRDNMSSNNDSERRVVQFAVASRAAVSLLALLTTLVVTPYDSSTHHAAGGHSPLTAFANWDGVYFAHIAQRGYDYEHVHAFFPLYPMLMRALSYVLSPLGDATAIVASGWLISNGSFVLAALWLYRLGRLVLQDEAVARRAAYLFCIAPSSIFMSAVYTESLICALSFGGMLALEQHKCSGQFRHLLLSAIAFGAASATRSNGSLLSLYIAWHRLCASPHPLTAPWRFLSYWSVTAMLGLIAIGPQVVYFVAAMRVYCPSLFLGTSIGAAASLLQSDRSWCASVVPNVSAMYMFIQREYWNVGFLRYYELKQAPNFVLAAPVIVLSAYSLVRFARASHSPHDSRSSRSKRTVKLTRKLEAPYYVHWLVLLVNALLVVHIQVTTRLLCACPPLFWAPAAFLVKSSANTDPTAGEAPRLTMRGRLVAAYFLLYTVLGAVLFPSFYPWT